MIKFTNIGSLELISVIIALATFPLGVKQKVITWPVSIAVTMLNFFIYYQVNLYDRCLLAVVGILNALYSWYQWLYGGEKRTPLRVTKTSPKTMGILLIIGIVGTFILGPFFKHFHSSYPYLGGLRTIFISIALWATAHKKLETYLLWFLLNILSALVCYYKGLYFFTIKYIIYLVLSAYGYYSWRKSYLEDQPKHLQNAH